MLDINLTPAQLRAMTRAQIRTAITDAVSAMTKREMIIWLIRADAVEDDPIDTYENGQIVRRVEITRDPETGERMRGRVKTWTYYPSGEVDVITISNRDAADGEVSKKRIKHYRDGRQPKEL